MRTVVQNAKPLIVNTSMDSTWGVVFLVSFMLMLGPVYLHSQCPDNGQTKVIKPNKGAGYYFYMFMGDSSFRYFLDGKTFSFNDKDDSGKTIIFIDNMAYELIVKDKGRDDILEFLPGRRIPTVVKGVHSIFGKRKALPGRRPQHNIFVRQWSRTESSFCLSCS